jgi:two-component system OmpR family response regulator
MDGAYELHRIVSDRTIDSHVRRVRAKFARLNAEPIETVHGIGYKLGSC